MTLNFDIMSSYINQNTPRFIGQLIPEYELNPSTGLGGDSEHTDTHTYKMATGINTCILYNIFPSYLHRGKLYEKVINAQIQREYQYAHIETTPVFLCRRAKILKPLHIWIFQSPLTLTIELRENCKAENQNMGTLLTYIWGFIRVSIKFQKWQDIQLHCNKEVNNINDLWWPWPVTYDHDTYIRLFPDT